MRNLHLRYSTFIFFLLYMSGSLVLSSKAHAKLFQIVNRDYNGNPQAPIDAAFDAFENSVNSSLPNFTGSDYLGEVADSLVLSGSNVASNYSTNFSTFLFGGQLGASLNLGNATLSSVIDNSQGINSLPSFGMQVALLLGIRPHLFLPKNIGPIETEKLRLFLSFFSGSAKVDQFELSVTSLGLTGQYTLIEPYKVPSGLFQWHGLVVGSGIRYATGKQVLSQNINTSYSAGGVTASMAGTLVVGSDANSWTIPLEVSSAVRMAYVFALFGGLAFDINVGSSEKITSLTLPVSVTSPAGVSGSAQVNLGNDSGPSFLAGRAFLGFGLDFEVLSVNLQVTQSLFSSAKAIGAGLQFYW